MAASAFWFGLQSVDTAPPAGQHQRVSTTVRLPAPRPVETPQVRMPVEPLVEPAPQREVRAVPVREVHISSPRVVKSATGPASSTAIAEPQAAPAKPEPVAKPQSDFIAPRPWNPRVYEGAAGRLVQIGAFGSTRQAKRGWWFMVRAYPAVAHLPAVVRTSQNSKGRAFYRFQVGTTSQAHSEILCQRMERIGLSCAVVGLPWKAKVER
jgi:hypothetical protein